MRKDFKAELANFKANNYLDKWIINMFALIEKKMKTWYITE